MKPFEKKCASSPKTYSELYSSSNDTHFPTTLNAFPQPESSKLGGWDVFVKGLEDGVFFDIPKKFLTTEDRLKANNLEKIKALSENDFVYINSEYTELKKLKNTNGDRDAFVLLVEKEKIKELLLSDEFKEDIYFPVPLSFFADEKIDAILSLAIRNKKNDIKRNAKLVRQALGSMREVIYSQRQEFLEKWCMRLGERVDDKCQENNPEGQDEATKEAMKFALRAILNMAQSLAAQPNLNFELNIKSISDLFVYDTSETKKPEQIFDRINNGASCRNIHLH